MSSIKDVFYEQLLEQMSPTRMVPDEDIDDLVRPSRGDDEEGPVAIAVGQPCTTRRFRCDGCFYEYIDGQHFLFVVMENPSPQEIEMFGSNKVKVGLIREPGAILFVVKFAERFQQVAPLSWELVAPGTPLPEDVAPGHATLLTMVLVDRRTNIVRQLRAATFTSKFTNSLHDAIRRHAASPHAPPAYAKALARLGEPIDRLWACIDDGCILGVRL